MNIILFDDPQTKSNLLPFTFIRPVSHIRIGILEIKEKWEAWLPGEYSYLTDSYLQHKYPQKKSQKNLYLNGCVLPNPELIPQLKNLRENQLLVNDSLPVALYGNFDATEEITIEGLKKSYTLEEVDSDILTVRQVHDIFAKNRAALIDDYYLLTKGKKSQPIEDPHTIAYNKDQIFIGENVTLRAAILNAESGPIYIGNHVDIGEGSIIKGASAVCDHAALNLGARIRGDATIGPYSKVGGEISNSVVFGYSSKAHDGYLGNSVIGEWCNMGADTNTSNLKNNYTNVKIWNYRQEDFVDTNRQFCGLMMGDHSKCGINTMFNTGTVVGVSSNIFGGGFPNTFIPSFSWGGAHGFETYKFEKALEVMPKVMDRRKKVLTEDDKKILQHIFEASKKYRLAYNR
jgi:UDP-N-acetylglucosamine diphosphorylase/glucosamine-1-phosphate N-acetyltransferase